jgi:hypothetical protein
MAAPGDRRASIAAPLIEHAPRLPAPLRRQPARGRCRPQLHAPAARRSPPQNPNPHKVS